MAKKRVAGLNCILLGRVVKMHRYERRWKMGTEDKNTRSPKYDLYLMWAWLVLLRVMHHYLIMQTEVTPDYAVLLYTTSILFRWFRPQTK